MTQKKIKAAVYSQVQLAEGIFSMWLGAGEMAKAAVPGQFIAVYPNDSARLLPRPISICETDPEKELLRIVYRVAGEGTKELSSCRAGDTLSIMGPLGNGFPLKDKKALLIGGGIGIPPMLELAKAKYAGLAVATEDGSVGTKGTVLDAIKAQGLKADIIYACGPTPMLRALKEYAAKEGIECWISLEERMDCGVGACLGCVCHSKDVDEHSNVRNKRVCKDGPVFLADEVELLSTEEQRERIQSGCMCGTAGKED